MNYYLSVLKKYATFKGRARRAEYWYFSLFNFIIIAIIQMSLILSTGNNLLNTLYWILTFLYLILVITPGLAVSVRRMHDVGKSGWWLLITFIPLIGGVWFFVLTVLDSTLGENKYGANPKESTIVQ